MSKVDETMKIMQSKPNREELDPETVCYHVEYSLHYARGLELTELLDSDIVKFDGTIVSKGKIWIFYTSNGYVIIPFKSIIHMHPQY